MVELSRSPGEWRAMADELEAAGRWKEALRCRHRALVADLVRRGVIPDQAGRTAREYAADVALGLPHAAVPMTDARSEEHTSELQSLMRISYAVFCLKKKNKTQSHNKRQTQLI